MTNGGGLELVSFVMMVALAAIQYLLKAKQDDEKRERERADKEIASLKSELKELESKIEAQAAKQAVYREEQVRQAEKVSGLDAKIDRAIELLERISGLGEPRGKSRP